ncbi:hypothetical protein M9Y10_013088 [Tritrichomonas musculus]|uniref:Uncharacterized protein n=1 Tax=Tritrichomonas musculus TaxID=1915356 RepID=A0ABR2I7G7_9EUKA
MSDKEGDSSEDIQTPIEFTVLQSETKSFQIPPDQDVFFTNAELLNIQPDSANKIVTLSIDYEVFYFQSENSSEDEHEENRDSNSQEQNINSNELNEKDESKTKRSHKHENESNFPKKALDHIVISIPVSSSLSTASDSAVTAATNSNQSQVASSSQPNTTENSFSPNIISQSYRYNSNSNSIPIKVQFCPDMNPVFHVSGPADVRLTGFTAPSNYNLTDEEEESEDEIDENTQDESVIDTNDNTKRNNDVKLNENEVSHSIENTDPIK